MSGVCTTVTARLTGTLFIYKFLTVKDPFRTRTWSRRNAHKICALIWGLCFISPTQLMLYFILPTSSNPVKFKYISNSCDYDYDLAPEWLEKLSDIYLFYMGFALVYFILIASSGYLVLKAWRGAEKHQRTVSWPGVLAVTLTAITLLVAFSPYIVVGVTIPSELLVLMITSVLRSCEMSFSFNTSTYNGKFLHLHIDRSKFQRFSESQASSCSTYVSQYTD
jgi:hypothetical protein